MITFLTPLLRQPSAWLVGAAFVPGVVEYFSRLWSLEHYQFFPFALVGAALLARRALAAPTPLSTSSRFVTFIWGAAGFGLLAVAVVLGSPWSAYAGALVMLAAGLYGAGGRSNVVRFAPAIVMLLTVLRPPLNLDLALITKLQQLTARAAEAALDVLDVVHVRSGNVIEIPGRRLFVEEACSGVNSLFSALACTLFYLLWTRRHPFVWVVLLGSVPCWVLAANAARITAVAVLRYRWNIAADEGLLHDALGLIVFAAAMLLILSTERLLTFYGAVLPPDDDPIADRKPAVVADSEIAVHSFRQPAWYLAVVTAALLLLLQLPALARNVRDLSQAARNVQIDELGAVFLADSFAGWKRSGYERLERHRGSAFGEYSQVWVYAGDAERATASLDYPFVGWHELTECYTAQGWFVESRTTIDAKGEQPPYVAVHMSHAQTGRRGRLWFTILTSDGRFLSSRKHGEWDELLDRVGTRLRDFSPTASTDDDRNVLTYQAQVFLESYAPPSTASVDGGLQLFIDLATRMNLRAAVNVH